MRKTQINKSTNNTNKQHKQHKHKQTQIMSSANNKTKPSSPSPRSQSPPQHEDEHHESLENALPLKSVMSPTSKPQTRMNGNGYGGHHEHRQQRDQDLIDSSLNKDNLEDVDDDHGLDNDEDLTPNNLSTSSPSLPHLSSPPGSPTMQSQFTPQPLTSSTLKTTTSLNNPNSSTSPLNSINNNNNSNHNSFSSPKRTKTTPTNYQPLQLSHEEDEDHTHAPIHALSPRSSQSPQSPHSISSIDIRPAYWRTPTTNAQTDVDVNESLQQYQQFNEKKHDVSRVEIRVNG